MAVTHTLPVLLAVAVVGGVSAGTALPANAGAVLPGSSHVVISQPYPPIPGALSSAASLGVSRLTPPTDPACSEPRPGLHRLTWRPSASPGAVAYESYVSVGRAPYTPLASVPGTVLTYDDTAHPGAAVSYYLVSRGARGEVSPASGVFTCPGAPGAASGPPNAQGVPNAAIPAIPANGTAAAANAAAANATAVKANAAAKPANLANASGVSSTSATSLAPGTGHEIDLSKLSKGIDTFGEHDGDEVIQGGQLIHRAEANRGGGASGDRSAGDRVRHSAEAPGEAHGEHAVSGRLPFTGAPVAALAGMSCGLIAAGAGMVIAVRRRRASRTR